MSLFPKIAHYIRFYAGIFVPLQCTKNHYEMAKKKILFINQEIAPYVPDSELSLPKPCKRKTTRFALSCPNGATSMSAVANCMR